VDVTKAYLRVIDNNVFVRSIMAFFYAPVIALRKGVSISKTNGMDWMHVFLSKLPIYGTCKYLMYWRSLTQDDGIQMRHPKFWNFFFSFCDRARAEDLHADDQRDPTNILNALAPAGDDAPVQPDPADVKLSWADTEDLDECFLMWNNRDNKWQEVKLLISKGYITQSDGCSITDLADRLTGQFIKYHVLDLEADARLTSPIGPPVHCVDDANCCMAFETQFMQATFCSVEGQSLSDEAVESINEARQMYRELPGGEAAARMRLVLGNIGTLLDTARQTSGEDQEAEAMSTGVQPSTEAQLKPVLMKPSPLYVQRDLVDNEGNEVAAHTEDGITATKCAEHCDAAKLCFSFTFGRWDGRYACYLKDKPISASDDSKPGRWAHTFRSYYKIIPEGYHARRLVADEGAQLNEIEGIDLAECASRCDAESSCKSFTYGFSEKDSTKTIGCYLKDKQVTMGDVSKEGAWAGNFNTYYKPDAGALLEMDVLKKLQTGLDHFAKDQHIEDAAALVHESLLQASHPGGLLHKAKKSRNSMLQVASNGSSNASFWVPFLPEVSTSTTSVPCIGLVIETTTVGACGAGTGMGMTSVSIGGTTLLTGQMATVGGVGGATLQTIGGGSLVLPYATMNSLAAIAGTTTQVCAALGVNSGTVMAAASMAVR